MNYFYIDGKKFNYNLEFDILNPNNNWKQNAPLIEYCETLGISIPHYCYHKNLSVAGNCRMCLIELKKSPKPVVSCAMNARSLLATNTEIYTDSPLVKKARENIMEFLLLNHPLDCPICDQGGECDLQDQSLFFGITKNRFYNFKRIVINKNIGPIVKTIMTRCIHCTRCVRFAQEIAGVEDLGIFGRGVNSEIGTYVNKLFKSELSGNVIDICPVGALTLKPYPFIGRSWELKNVNSIDFSDGFGTDLQFFIKNNKIIKALSGYNYDKKENNWISDKTRFIFDGMFTPDRKVTKTISFGKKEITIDSWDQIFKKLILTIYFYDHLSKYLFQIHSILIIFDENTSIEVLNILLLLEKKYPFFKIRKINKTNACNDFESNLQLNTGTKTKKLINFDACILIGTNPRFEGSYLNLKLRERFLKGNFKLYKLNSLTNTTIPTISLGSNIKNLKSISEGTHQICQDLKKTKKLLLIINSEIYSRKDSKAILNMIKTIEKNTNFNTEILNKFDTLNSSLNSTGINMLHKFKTIKQNDIPQSCGIYYINSNLQNTNLNKFLELKTLNYLKTVSNTKFIIEQSNKLKQAITKITKNKLNIYNYFFLPNNTFYETANTYINTEGITKNTIPVISALKNTKNDWQIIRKLFSYTKKLRFISNIKCNNLIEFNNNKLSSFKNYSHFIHFPHQHLSTMTFCLKNKTNQSFSLTAQKYKSSINSLNTTIFNKQIDDFYIGGSDNYTKSSTTMIDCSKVLRSNTTNFLVY